MTQVGEGLDLGEIGGMDMSHLCQPPFAPRLLAVLLDGDGRGLTSKRVRPVPAARRKDMRTACALARTAHTLVVPRSGLSRPEEVFAVADAVANTGWNRRPVGTPLTAPAGPNF